MREDLDLLRRLLKYLSSEEMRAEIRVMEMATHGASVNQDFKNYAGSVQVI